MSKYVFKSKFTNLVKQLQENYQWFTVAFDKASSKEDVIKSFNTLYNNKVLTNVGNYLIYFSTISDIEVLQFIKEQVDIIVTNKVPKEVKK